MPRIPEADLQALKSTVDIATLIRAKGIELKPHGSADLIGRCPFHDDKTPSLVVTPAKALWHCLGACQMGGDVVSWVMKAEGVSFRHAVELLRDGRASTLLASSKLIKTSTVPKLPPPVSVDTDDQTLLNQVTGYYHRTLLEDPLGHAAREYLKKRGLFHPEAVQTFKLGYANRTLGLRLPDKNRQEGAAIRARLSGLGVMRQSTGHEHLAGSLIVPILDESGNAQGLYGRKVIDTLRPGTPKHLYLPGPHRGIFNPAALCQSDIILCESLLDALSFWVSGFRNVTSSYGVEGFTEEMLSSFLSRGVRRVIIAYDRDEAGDKAAERLADKLMGEGIECLRLLFPHGMDANAYVRKMTPADKALKVLLNSAQWLGKGAGPRGARPQEATSQEAQPSPSAPMPLAPTPVSTPAQPRTASLPGGERMDVDTGEVLPPASLEAPALTPAPAASSAAADPSFPLAAAALAGSASAVNPAPSVAGPMAPAGSLAHSPSPSAASPTSPTPPIAAPPAIPSGTGQQGLSLPHSFQGDDVHITLGDRSYRVRGLQKNLSFEVLKVNLRASVGERYYLDTLDFYNAKARESFILHASPELEYQADVLKRDMGRLLNFLEALQQERITQAQKPKERPTYAMTAHELSEALAYLKAPGLLQRITSDLTLCGYVGEDMGKQVGYLVSLSRKLQDPLSVIVQSSSASGKSSLMDAVLAMVPPEDKLELSSLTSQALFYMEPGALCHKLLSVAEDGGMAQAEYSLKNLITGGKLSKAAPGKDPHTGRVVTQIYEVEGPAAVMVSSTASDIEPELKNRCLVVTLNEEREQTEAILRLQRFAQTLEGKRQRGRRSAIRHLHHNLQRLLRAVEVVNPFAPLLRFSSEQSRLRRDQMKYLGLMNTLALLHQYQRPIRRDSDAGEYVEVTLEDVASANRIAAEVLGRTLDELAPQTRRLLNLLTAMVKAKAEEKAVDVSQVRLCRFDIRREMGWGHSQLAVHLSRLVALEYLVVHRGARGLFEYELIYRGEGEDGGRFVLGLIDVEELRKKVNGHPYESQVPGLGDDNPGGVRQVPGAIRGASGGLPAPIRDGQTPLSANKDKGVIDSNPQNPENAQGQKSPSSYRSPLSYPKQTAAKPSPANPTDEAIERAKAGADAGAPAGRLPVVSDGVAMRQEAA